jgi:hypothetical protein
MQPDDDAALAAEAAYAAALSNVIKAAKKSIGATWTARTLIVFIEVLVGDDPVARAMVAKELVAAAHEMDPDVMQVRHQ